MFSAATKTGTAGGYQISRSLRFNSADSAYLNRTPASAGNRKTWTWSGWVKRSSLTTASDVYLFGARSGTPWAGITFGASGTYADTLQVTFTAGSAQGTNTTQVFRDASAWYHIVVAVDTTQATAADRIKVYVNGTQVTSFAATNYPSQNFDTQINSTIAHYIGSSSGADNFFPGYLTEINFIDGQALTPSSFGETNAQTGVWQPKAYSGSYGTNGFYLNFSDNSNTTAATLGKDYSGNGNNWTPNNFSVTAGAGNDSLVDSPTAYGFDTGVGGEVRGNYCTWNPVAAYGSSAANGNLDATVTGSGFSGNGVANGTISVNSGKWYWEITPISGTGYMIGISDVAGAYNNRSYNGTYGWGYYFSNGQKYTNGAGVAYGATWTTNDVIGVALDMDAGTITFYKNGTSQGVAFTGLNTGRSVTPMVSDGSGSLNQIYYANFGQRPFAYTAPSGYKALCTQNLPTPTIGATTATQAGKYFNPVLYTGTGSSLGVTGVGFQPDWVWIKERNAAADHGLYDAVRGVQKQLESNTTDAETTETTGLTAFNSDGFTVGALAQLNTNNDTYVAWNWKANGAGVTNTAGTITSTVSANTTSGFSIVTYTGTGANATVGHGLGVAPSMIIQKNRTGFSWRVYHISTGNGNELYLDTTAAATSASTWNNTTPTSTVFSIGSGSAINGGSNACVAYCFAEVPGYSRFGSYTGNGADDGPFVFTGFKPAWILIKRSSTAGENWTLYDNKRNSYNVANRLLFPNSSDGEDVASATILDMVSNGFKLRGQGLNVNASGSTYIYAAFAENPFKYSLAR